MVKQIYSYLRVLATSDTSDPSDASHRHEDKAEELVRIFQKLLKAKANRRVRMCNLQSAKDCASVKTSLATVRARAQEMKTLKGMAAGFV